jgi:hypothetical protein
VRDEGFPTGIALDDGVAAVFAGTELVEVVTDRPDAGGYVVSPEGERILAVSRLTC